MFKAKTILFVLIAVAGFWAQLHAAPILVQDSPGFTVTADDGDSAIEPNECIGFTITLVNNDGADGATGISGTLSSDTAGVTVSPSAATQTFPDIAALGNGTSNGSFEISVSPAFGCGVPIELHLDLTTDQGPFTVPITLTTGSVPPVTTTFSSGTVNKTIRDGKSQAISAITTSGITNPIANVIVKVNIQDNADADLVLTLIGPDRTTVVLSNHNGAGADYGSDCTTNATVFDDSGAATPSITTGSSPFIGTFKSQDPLSVFNGKTGTAANGKWTLKVKDTIKNGTAQGKVVCWAIVIVYASACGDGGVCAEATPSLVFDSASVATDNLVADVNDCFDLNALLRNDGTLTATGITGVTLTSSTPGVSILQGTSDYSDIAAGATVNESTPFQVETSPDVACGSTIDFLLSGSSTEGGAFALPFSMVVGTTQPAAQATAGVNGLNIPDGNSGGVDLPLDADVTGITGTIGSVNVGLNILHDNNPDLTISLVGPDNTTVILTSGASGLAGSNLGTDCSDPSDETVFDDAAGGSIAGGTAPYLGTFTPEEPLSAFVGKNPNGTWKLHVVDNDNNNLKGDIECWTLNLVTCIDGNCCPTITVTPATLPTGTVNADYGTQTGGASGGAAPYTFAITAGSLPDGLSFQDNGDDTWQITGTPTVSGDFDFTVTATDVHGCHGSQAYSVTIDCTGTTITIDDDLTDGTVGVDYTTQDVTAGGGSGSYSYAVTSGAVPTGLTFHADGTIDGTPTVVNTFNFDVTATDTNTNCTGTASYTVVIVSAFVCIFCDDFNDGNFSTLSGPWTTKGGSWSPLSGDAVATVTRKGDLISPAFSCTNCTFESHMKVDSGGRVSMFGWYVSGKNNVEIRLFQDAQKILFKQKINGSARKKVVTGFSILPNHIYDVAIHFDGTNFTASIDGTPIPLLTFPKLANPSGKVLLRVKSPSGASIHGTIADFSAF
jgi:subtilisin-like proprotein convertase family protein